jgi:hypothetical protein
MAGFLRSGRRSPGLAGRLWKRYGSNRVSASRHVPPGRPRSAGSCLPSYPAHQRKRTAASRGVRQDRASARRAAVLLTPADGGASRDRLGMLSASGQTLMYTVGSVPVPDFQTLMRPLLVALEDGAERSISEVRSQLAREFSLSDVDLAEELPSGRAKTFPNRVGWATTYLYRCGLLERPRRSVYRITDRGRDVL